MSRGSQKTPDYEKLGRFFMGGVAAEGGEPESRPFLYDMNDLQTHAVCVGMTGSGKTGLAITMLEEAAIDGVPVIAIDPKGDLPNLLLCFPKLEAEDFRPWIERGVAGEDDALLNAEARKTAESWRKGLAAWNQGPERVARYARACERRVYTPGSDAGCGLAMLRSFAAPAPDLLADEEAFRDRVVGAVSGLLGLLGVNADPSTSREHVFLCALLERAWKAGSDLDLAGLIHQVQKSPIDRIGVMDLETFFPAGERFGLAMKLNSLLASPGFGAWSRGDSLDVQTLLYGTSGKPRISIVSIAHLDDAERMFVVTSLLHEIVAWMRTQPGSRSLRAVLYMDEVFGYLPPTANPPSKRPLLTLLKQARAYGLGVVLATQNPVDLDYKALSNAGTWFLGRLSTERDKARVLDGLEGTAAAGEFDRHEIDAMLSALPSRSFLVRNVHEDAPVVIQTRHALCYLAGPMTREQIKRLVGDDEPARAAARPAPSAPAAAASPLATLAAPPTPVPTGATAARPALPAGVSEVFAPATLPPGAGERLVYRPSLAAEVVAHYANARANVDEWTALAFVVPLAGGPASPWRGAIARRALGDLHGDPEPGARFAELPAVAARTASYARWNKQLHSHVYREARLELWKSSKPRLVSRPGETEGAFRGRVRDALREQRAAAVEKLRRKYAPGLRRIQNRIATAEQRVERERSQYASQKLQTAISVGSTLIGALFGRRSSSVGRATTAARGAGRTMREREDVDRAEETVERLNERLEALDAELADDIAELSVPIDADALEIAPLRVAPRKSDIEVPRLVLLWRPWRVTADGFAEPAFTDT